MVKNQADKLYDLKGFVKQKYFETMNKLKELEDEQAKQKFFLEICQEIRLQIDSLTKEGQDQSSDQNLKQCSQLQLSQVKMILTSFLRSASSQMKASEKELSDVVDIINQKESIMPQSTNSLIIKLWNTILTSVSEFKTTYVTYQSGISQQLGIMDGKLDSIMDSIEAGKNEVLLELYKISKVQDMTLEKSQEKTSVKELLAQAKTLQLDLFNLSQTNIQLPAFDINKMSAPLLLTHLNPSHASIIGQQEQLSIQTIPVVFQKKWQLNAFPELCNHFNDKGNAHYTIILCKNGNIVVGGFENKLYQYSSAFKELQVKDIDDLFYNGLEYGELLYCVIGIKLMILDQNTLDTINTINIQANVKKMLQVDDYIIFGQQWGYLEIISISQQKKVFARLLKQGSINDIVKLNNDEYAFACQKGLYLANITLGNQQILFKQNIDAYYFKDQAVSCVYNLQKHLLIVAVEDNKQLQLVDRQCRQVIKQIGQFDGCYNVITKILGYDEQSFPYIIVKDNSTITIINIITYDIISTTNCQYDSFSWKSSVAQKQIDNKLYLFTLTYNLNKDKRGIRQLEIGNLQ